jgi:hypothetical protein
MASGRATDSCFVGDYGDSYHSDHDAVALPAGAATQRGGDEVLLR